MLLDHGLYRELPRHFVTLYAELWAAIVLGDADGIRAVGEALGVGGYYPLLAAMLTNRPWGDVVGGAGSARLRERNTAADRAQIAGYAQQYLKQIVHVLECVPPPMLLLFKTNDCLRHAERQLDAGVDSFLITLRFCLQALLAAGDREDARGPAAAAAAATESGGARNGREAPRAHALRTRLRARLRRLRLRVAFWILRLLTQHGGGDDGVAARTVRLLVAG